MTTTSERVRRAINATAEQITADSIPPFRVPEPARRFSGRPQPDARSWPAWLAPVAAAVSMAIIAAAVLVVSNISHPRPTDHIGAVPPYYAALTLESPPLRQPPRIAVTIRATATGKVLATVQSQAPHFIFRSVAAAADDRTFVVAAARPAPSRAPSSTTAPVRFYLLRFNPAASTVSVTQLPIRNVTASSWNDPLSIALSPDGRHLAVITSAFHGVRVYMLRAGAGRSWVTSPHNTTFDTLLGPSWAPDNRTLAIFIFPPEGEPKAPRGTYLLDTTNQARSLLAASRPVRALRRSSCSPPYFLPQESTIVCRIIYSHRGVLKGFVAHISVRTGKVLRRLNLPSSLLAPLPDASLAGPEVAFAGRPGAPVIIVDDQLRPRPYGSTSAYLLTSSGVTKLPRATWIGELSVNLTVAW